MDTKAPPSRQSKTLIIVRHAHRDIVDSDRETDNGLSDKGKRQAKKIQKYFRERFKKETPLLISSPKRRCIETLEPIAKKKKIEIAEHALLDEGGDLRTKVKNFIKQVEQKPDPIVMVCSHADWIDTFFDEMIGINSSLQKGGWLELSLESGQPRLTWMLQSVAA